MAKINVSIEALTVLKNSITTISNFSPSINLATNSLCDIIRAMEQAFVALEESISEVISSLERVDLTLQNLNELIKKTQAEKARFESELLTLTVSLADLSNKDKDTIYKRIKELNQLIKEKTAQISKCKKDKKNITDARKKLEHLNHKISTDKNRVQGFIKDIEKTEPQINEIQVKISKASETALTGLNSIENIINDYCALNIHQTTQPEKYVKKITENPYPTTDFYQLTQKIESYPINYAEDISESEKDELQINKSALEGSFLFLENTGYSFNSFDTSTDEEKIKILMEQGAPFDEAKRIVSIYNSNFLADEKGAHEAFLSTSPQSTGDSYEWQRFFYNLRHGHKTAKEVPFDLTKYKGEKCFFLGYSEEITNVLRKTDVVRYEGNREIHEELKVGRANSKKSLAEFRQELYGDDLRLRLYPNHEQEYRIRKNASNGKCLFDDKERAMYLYFMACRHPNRVRVYFNDKLLSLDELRYLGEK